MKLPVHSAVKLLRSIKIIMAGNSVSAILLRSGDACISQTINRKVALFTCSQEL